jgi:hypothetical protein
LNDNAPLALDTVYGKKKFNGYVAIDALISPELAGNMLERNECTSTKLYSKKR